MPTMDESDIRIVHALEQTRVVRAPRQHLATFGVTRLSYYVLTEPSYSEFAPHEEETVVREGKVIAERPAIVTPSYLMNLEGFGDDARRSMGFLANRLGPNSPGLLYTYKNEASGLNIIGGRVEAVADRVGKDLDKSSDNLATVIIGVDELWDVCLLKFIYEFTAASAVGNLQELHGHGLLDPDPSLGIPAGAAQQVERLFQAVETEAADPSVLKRELDRWGLFSRYEDRFLRIFRRKSF